MEEVEADGVSAALSIPRHVLNFFHCSFTFCGARLACSRAVSYMSHPNYYLLLVSMYSKMPSPPPLVFGGKLMAEGLGRCVPEDLAVCTAVEHMLRSISICMCICI